MTAPAIAKMEPTRHHSVLEDAVAIAAASFLMAWGIVLIQALSGVSGGLAGAAFIGSYAFHQPVGLIFFLINVPFYYFAVRRMGWIFTIKTFATVGLTSFFTWLHPLLIDFGPVQPLFACVFSAIALGVGMIIAFRHGASAGGFGIIAAYVQERFGLRAGFLQGALDFLVVLAAIQLVPPSALFCSIAGVALLNVIIAMNHKPNRYLP